MPLLLLLYFLFQEFDELFSGKCNLTVNEDIHNTITPNNKKELSFNEFRVFGTCPAEGISKLSEAIISRFTLIYVGEYGINEQEIALKSYRDYNKLETISDNIIKKMIEYFFNLNKNFPGFNFTLFHM